MFRNAEESDDYDDVWRSFIQRPEFINGIPVKETIDSKIFVKKEIKPFCKKSILQNY